MSRAKQLWISTLVHGVLMLFLFAGFWGMISFVGLRWQVPLIVTVLLVGAAGFVKRVKWGNQHHGYFLAGLVIAVILLTGAFHVFTWVLTHPVGPAPPFATYLRHAVDDAEGIAITLGPIVLMIGASLLGYSLASRYQRDVRASKRREWGHR